MRKNKPVSEFISRSVEETFLWGKNFGSSLKAGTSVALRGDLGAGKTTLMKGIAHGLIGVEPREVTSPTFTYLNIYSSSCHSLYHFDLYRIKGPADFIAMGFQEYLQQHICCIEWPERIEELLPETTVEIELFYLNEEQRRVVVRGQI